MPSCSAITSTLPASNIIRRIYPPADEVCLLAGPERPLAQVTQDTSAWPELNVCWLVGMSLALLAISVGVPTIVGMRRNAQDHNSTARRRGGDSCPSAAQPICESFHTFPWGSQTRLLVCTNPDCAKVLRLIRFGGHLSKGEYDVHTDGRDDQKPASPPTV
jgi:hypothetical protein